jgi:hypothetical protein
MYTAKIEEGINLKEYAGLCAKAFGYCIDLRDSPFDGELPKSFKPCPDSKIEYRRQLTTIEVLGELLVAEALKKSKAEFNMKIFHYKQSIEIAMDRVDKYSNMLKKVKSWKPPTENHINLKTFMIEQLEQSIEFEDVTYHRLELEKVLSRGFSSGHRWRELQIKEAEKEAEYYKKDYIKEVNRCRASNTWLRQLRESL